MSANASANSPNANAKNTANAKNAGNVAVAKNTSNVAANTKPAAGFLNGLFAKKPEASANVNKSVLNQKNRNAANLVIKNQQHSNAKKAASGPGLMNSLFGAAKPANSPANAPAAAAAEAALNAPAANAKARARTLRRQRGGARGKTMRLPGPRNVLRVTGKTVGKIRNVGVYGLKKVGNGVHMVTGLLGAGTKLVGSVLRKGGKTLKGLTKRRQQTRKQ